MSKNAATASTLRLSGAKYYLAAVAVALGGSFAVGWVTSRELLDPQTADVVVRELVMDQDEVIGVCLNESPLGPGDGAGTCGAAFLAGGVVDDPLDLIDKRVKVTVLDHEKKHGMPVFLIEAAP